MRKDNTIEPQDESADKTLLYVNDLKVYFDIPSNKFLQKNNIVKAVDNISFSLNAGETLGIVGESGCGKSTLGRAILQLIKPTSGQVLWLGQDLAKLDQKSMWKHRKELQIIFQDPLAALNPRMTIGEIIAEPLRSFRSQSTDQISEQDIKSEVLNIMEKVGLLPQMLNRYPHEFSGGQCQRIGIARAMILKPKLIICDEPVSALDVSIQAQVINLLLKLQKEFSISLIFISHDLSVVQHICHRVMVLYLGKIMEIATTEKIYSEPLHPYTQALISAIPEPDPRAEKIRKRIVLKGDLPSPINPPSGCVFRTRCLYAQDLCITDIPSLTSMNQDSLHSLACHFYQNLTQI